jgi:hypothetical protein
MFDIHRDRKQWFSELERQIERLPSECYDLKVKLRKLLIEGRAIADPRNPQTEGRR